jgi:hypothetical protein
LDRQPRLNPCRLTGGYAKAQVEATRRYRISVEPTYFRSAADTRDIHEKDDDVSLPSSAKSDDCRVVPCSAGCVFHVAWNVRISDRNGDRAIEQADGRDGRGGQAGRVPVSRRHRTSARAWWNSRDQAYRRGIRKHFAQSRSECLRGNCGLERNRSPESKASHGVFSLGSAQPTSITALSDCQLPVGDASVLQNTGRQPDCSQP